MHRSKVKYKDDYLASFCGNKLLQWENICVNLQSEAIKMQIQLRQRKAHYTPIKFCDRRINKF